MIIAKYVVLPAIGIGIVTGADKLGLLPSDSLFHFVLMLQFTLPPAMNIGKQIASSGRNVHHPRSFNPGALKLRNNFV